MERSGEMIHRWGAKQTELIFDRFGYPTDGHPFGYEPEIINAFEHFAEPGDVAIDAGASVGFHTCLLAKLVGEEGLVFAFEPHLESFKMLVQHVHASNKLNNVMCLKIALWDRAEKELKLWSPLPLLGYSSFHSIHKPVTCDFVEGVKLDDMLIDIPENHPRIIKIDCEGTEELILRGAENTLRKGVDCVIIEFNYFIMDKAGLSDSTIREFMQQLGYEMFLINIGTAHNGNYHPPIKVDPDKTLKLEGGHAINVLFSTQEKVNERWKINGSEEYGGQALLRSA
jgi:FkbM family methyltransferase